MEPEFVSTSQIVKEEVEDSNPKGKNGSIVCEFSFILVFYCVLLTVLVAVAAIFG